MFISVGEDIKFHSVSENGELENFVVDYPSSNNNIIGISISNDNTYVAILREDEDPQILHTKGKFGPQLIHTIPVDSVTTLVFKRTTKRYLTLGTEDGTILNYDIKDKKVTRLHRRLGDIIRTLDYTCDDRELCGIFGDVLFYFTERGNLQKFRQRSICTCLRCHHEIPGQAALGLKDGSVIVWELTLGQPFLQLDLFLSPVSAITMSSCGTFLTAVADKVEICGLDIEESCCNFQHTITQELPVTAMDVRYDDKYLVIGLKDGTIKVYDVQKITEPICTKKLHNGSIRKILFENKTLESNSDVRSTIGIFVENKPEVDEIEESRLLSPTGSTFVLEHEPVPTTPKAVNDKSGADKVENEDENEEDQHEDEKLDEDLAKLRDRLFALLKTEVDCLEAQFEKHCSELQKFMDNEFENINMLMKSTFENQDEIFRILFSKAGKKSEPRN